MNVYTVIAGRVRDDRMLCLYVYCEDQHIAVNEALRVFGEKVFKLNVHSTHPNWKVTRYLNGRKERGYIDSKNLDYDMHIPQKKLSSFFTPFMLRDEKIQSIIG